MTIKRVQTSSNDRHPGKSNCHFHLSNAQQCGTRGEYQNYMYFHHPKVSFLIIILQSYNNYNSLNIFSQSKVSFLIASLMVDEPSSHPPHTHHVNATSANASLINTTSKATQFKVICSLSVFCFWPRFLVSGPGWDWALPALLVGSSHHHIHHGCPLLPQQASHPSL